MQEQVGCFKKDANVLYSLRDRTFLAGWGGCGGPASDHQVNNAQDEHRKNVKFVN